MSKAKVSNILIISLFGEIKNPNSRVFKIDKAFSVKTTFVTANFNHASKTFKDTKKDTENPRVRTYYLRVPQYSYNLSFRRIFSHLVFAFRLSAFLNNLKEKPDIVFCLIPPSSAANVAGRFCKKNKIFFVVDVIDIWPDSLIPLSKYKWFVNILITPWKKLTQKVYHLANYISGESKLYALVAHKNNPVVPWSYTYLGVDISDSKWQIANSNIKLNEDGNEIRLCYGGNLGNSYDFETILEALRYIQSNGINYKMYFVGDGQKAKEIVKFSDENNLNVEITGRLEYKDYLKCLSLCDIGFNSFNENTKVVHSYKFNDYCAAGLFIFNNLSGETYDMVEKYDIGINYNKNNLSENLFEVCKNWGFYNYKRILLNNLINNELDTNLIYTNMKSAIIEAYLKF